MQSHKLVLESIVEDNYELIAIHSALEEYRLCYQLNKYLGLRLCRAEKDLDFKSKTVQSMYSLYKYEDRDNMCNFFLVSNKQKGEEESIISSGSLFSEETESITTHLIPEFKRVDFFLKIEDGPSENFMNQMLIKINQIPHIATAYKIEFDQIKNKENLIFE